MNFKNVYATKGTANEAVADIKAQLDGFKAKMILFFASSCFEPAGISHEMQQAFPEIPVFGCTTSGEITSGHLLDNSVVAMAFNDQVIGDVKVEVLLNIKEDMYVVPKAFAAFEQHFGMPMRRMNPDEYVGLVLIDGVSGCEEKINDRVGDLTNVTFIGGSAGDDLQFKCTYVFANGQAYSDAALLILLKPLVKFDVLKTQSFQPTDHVLEVTKSNEARREILEFNHQPAAQAYANALQVPVAELPEHFLQHPLGLMFGGHTPFVRSPQTTDNKSIILICSVKEGMQLTVLRSTDIIEDTALALEQKQKEMGGISAIINFNCILRTVDLKQQNRTKQYASLFKEIPTIGFSTYGESYIGHMNQTATMLLLQ